MPTAVPQDVYDAVEVIRRQDSRIPEMALILGSGLGALADEMDNARSFPAPTLPGYPASTVPGHRGELVLGELEGRTVAIVRGRVHAYEGHPIRKVTFPVRLLYALGARKLIVTNAAGGIHPLFVPGDLMFITDHIGLLTGRNPLVGPNVDGGPRFPDMSEPYSRAWTDRAEALALRLGIRTRRGVYIWTLGPSYETPAEIAFFRRIGADAVGMSTVPEVIQARYFGMDVLGISAITNRAAGLQSHLSHEEVLEIGRRIQEPFSRLIRAIVAEG